MGASLFSQEQAEMLLVHTELQLFLSYPYYILSSSRESTSLSSSSTSPYSGIIRNPWRSFLPMIMGNWRWERSTRDAIVLIVFPESSKVISTVGRYAVPLADWTNTFFSLFFNPN